jgi:PAS domain S-box-containing protein
MAFLQAYEKNYRGLYSCLIARLYRTLYSTDKIDVILGQFTGREGQAFMFSVHKLSRQRALLLLFSLGALSLFSIDTLLTQGFVKDQAYRERVTAERMKSQVQSSLEEHVTALLALKVVYQNFTDINSYDFTQYGKSITSTLHGFERLFYIDSKMTIQQVYPSTAENKGLYQYSLRENPQVSAALKTSKLALNPSTSRLLSIMGHPKNFWAFIPIYRSPPDAPPHSHLRFPIAKHQEFLGYAVGEVSLEKLWQSLSLTFTGYQVQLIDPTGSRLFTSLSQVKVDKNDSPELLMPFSVGGNESWTLVLRPLHATAQAMLLLLLRMGLWLGGFLILFLASKIISSSDKHKAQLDEARQQFQTIVEASPDGILLLDSNLRLLITNAVVRNWLGKSHEELQDKTFFELFGCQCPSLSSCREVNRLLCTSEQFAAELPNDLETGILNPPDGLPKTLRLNASKITHIRQGRREEGFICVLGDISTRKELDRVKETYVATLTHDLKTPLLAQQMVLETLVSRTPGPINDEQRKLLVGAWESVQDLVDMVNSTLLFYKLEASHVSLHRQPRAVAPLIKDVMQTLKPLAEKRDVHLEIDTAVDLPEAAVDIIQIKRVFHNLLSNAIHYSRKGSPIRASLRFDREQGCILIEFYNEGKGITADELPKIFDKYHSSSRKFKQIGSGLGLYISRRIIELHGGKVWATSTQNEDARFFISLPCLQSITKKPIGEEATIIPPEHLAPLDSSPSTLAL